MLVNANFNYIQPTPFCKGEIKYEDSNSKMVKVSFNMNGYKGKGETIDKNNNHCFKVSFTENKKTNDVVFKIPINKIDEIFLTSAITYAYLNITNNFNIKADKITINIIETDNENYKKGVRFEAKMLDNLDDVEFISDVEEPNINSISQGSEIIDNDIQSQQGWNNVEKQSINDVGSRNLSNNISINDDDNSNNDIVDIDNNAELNKSEEDNNDILPECCNNCITGLQNLWNKIKCW